MSSPLFGVCFITVKHMNLDEVDSNGFYLGKNSVFEAIKEGDDDALKILYVKYPNLAVERFSLSKPGFWVRARFKIR